MHILYVHSIHLFIHFLFIFQILRRDGKKASSLDAEFPFDKFHIYCSFARSVSLCKFKHIFETLIYFVSFAILS